MENRIFADDENVSLVVHCDVDDNNNHGDNFDVNCTQNTMVEEEKLAAHNSADKQPTSSLQLSRKVKQKKTM